MFGPSKRQLDVLRLIAQSVQSRGFAPSAREVGSALGIRSTNGVSDHFRALESKGYLRRAPGIARGLLITAAGHAALKANP
jgi:repressor LexA